MSKFSRLASGTPAALTPGQPTNSLYPAPLNTSGSPSIPPRPGSAQPPSTPQQQYQQYQPQPYPQGPSIPPRPSSAQPPYQPPSWGGQQQQQYPQSPYPQTAPPTSFTPQLPQQSNMYRPGGSPQPPQGFPQSPYSQQGPSSAPGGYQPYQQPHQGQYQQPYQQPYQQQQQQPYQFSGPGYPQGQQGYPGGPPQGPPSGQPYPQQQGQGQRPPPPQGGGQNIGAYKNLLQACIQEKGLQPFYPPNSPQLDAIAQRASQQVSILADQWRVNPEIAQDIVKLALYDVILYVDDSGSMAFEENGERIDDLKLIISRVSFAAGLFDDDGIQVRFMNSTQQGNNIKTSQQVDQLISSIRFQGLTPMGRELQNKVLQPLVLGAARAGQLRKPVLVIIVTDGQPTGESQRDIANIILGASRELQSNPRCGKGAVAFQFAQVGNDLKAREFLKQLDENREIGDIIDCTSNFEVEQDEMSRANPPVNLTPELWLIKLLLGSIDHSYDKQDEQTSSPPPQQGNYGQLGGQYGQPQGPPQGQYGQPPPGQYGGYPPQGQQQQGGYPPQGYPPQGGRGGPPQGPPSHQPYPQQQGQGGYPPQQPRY